MKTGEPIPLKTVLDPKPPVTEMIAPPSIPLEQGATIDGFSFGTHTTGGHRRKLPHWFKIVALIFLGWTVLGLLAQAADIVYSLIRT
jgi:hypothetical protein